MLSKRRRQTLKDGMFIAVFGRDSTKHFHFCGQKINKTWQNFTLPDGTRPYYYFRRRLETMCCKFVPVYQQSTNLLLTLHHSLVPGHVDRSPSGLMPLPLSLPQPRIVPECTASQDIPTRSPSITYRAFIMVPPPVSPTPAGSLCFSYSRYPVKFVRPWVYQLTAKCS